MDNLIKHIWFDFSETIASLQKERHDQLRYETYSAVIGKEVSPELIQEYELLYEQHKHSNAAIFRSLGKESGFWSDRVNSVPSSELYILAEQNIPEILQKLAERLPISVFSNIRLENVLPDLEIKTQWFTHILSSADVNNPKPALDGFYKMVELSNLPANQILYIGDNVEKDVLPAKAVGAKAGLIYSFSDRADYNFKDFGDVLKIITE